MKKKILLQAITFIFIFKIQIHAQSFVIDSVFAGNGQVSTGVLGGTQISNILQQPDNKMILAGYHYDSGCNCLFNDMLRVDACGQIDTAFGVNGLVQHTFDQRNIGSAYALQPDGKILVAGTQASSNGASQHHPFIARYNSNGSPDTTFGTMGTNKLAFLGQADFSFVHLLPDGKILCTGSPIYSNHLMVRFDSTGAVDNSFGINGVVQHSIPSGMSSLNGFKSLMRNDGKIISATSGFFDQLLMLSCYDTLGVEDTTFGVNGYIVDPNFPMGGYIPEIVFQSDYKLVVAKQNPTESSITMARYNTNGSVDSTYGINGYVNIPTPSIPGRILLLSIFNDDKILLAYEESGVASVFLKFDTNGTPDPNFFLNGSNSFVFASNNDKPRKALILNNNEITMGGNGSGFSLARFVENPTVAHINQNGFVLNANVSGAGVTYQWSLNGSTIIGATDSIYTFVQSGTYSVEVTNMWGCSSFDSISVTNTGIENENIVVPVFVYPNPANESLTISSDLLLTQSEYVLNNAVGETVLTGKTTGDLTTIKIGALSTGIYFLKIVSKQSITTVKVIKN